MGNEKKIEMSKIDNVLPRYYKGYDIDELLTKAKDPETGKTYNSPLLTEQEWAILNEVDDIYYTKEFEEREKEWENAKQESITNGEHLHMPLINNPFVQKIDS